MHNVLANADSFTIYYTMFRTAPAVRYAQYSLIIFKTSVKFHTGANSV